jgi:hypothetical protein
VTCALALAAAMFMPLPARAADEECDAMSMKFASPADNLCVPAIASNINFVINGIDAEWTNGIFYDHAENWGGLDKQARLRISRKATGINKSDLFLFFNVTGDTLATGLDEIRIGLNPGTDPAKSILIKIHPNPIGPTLPKETFTFDAGMHKWVSAGNGNAWMPAANVATVTSVNAGTWTTEVKISLDAIPTNPITGADFRLHAELFADDGVQTINYQWPPQYNYVGLHDFICANPERDHPMSFATGSGGNCPHQDLNIANGAYSCGDVYILRNGVKSTEIAINQINEFHADVSNPGPGTAPDAEVYLTLLQLGTSTAPIAANFDNTNATIVNFFNSKYGAWMTATDKLDSGTPKPPTPFNVPVPIETGARFKWKPADETRFGDPAKFVGTHKCTAAFVNFKDDPNFANNFSFCNTSVVACPTGQLCAMALWIGQAYPYIQPKDGKPARLAVSVINAPFAGWLKAAKLTMEGSGAERIRENVFEIHVPERREVPVRLSMTIPRVAEALHPSVVPAAFMASPEPIKPPRGRGSDPIKERSVRLAKIYGNRPLLVVQNFVPISYETGLNQNRNQLFAPTSYVAFAINTKPIKPFPSPRPAPSLRPTPPVGGDVP